MNRKLLKALVSVGLDNEHFVVYTIFSKRLLWGAGATWRDVALSGEARLKCHGVSQLVFFTAWKFIVPITDTRKCGYMIRFLLFQ